MVSRISHAVDLYKEKYAPKILVSGGFDKEDHINEAQIMKKIAIEHGVAARDIILETSSTSTYENLLFSHEIMNRQHLRSVLLVTEPFHSPRASLVATKLGFTYTVSPAVDSICWLQGKYLSKYFLKEPLAIIIYKLENKL